MVKKASSLTLPDFSRNRVNSERNTIRRLTRVDVFHELTKFGFLGVGIHLGLHLGNLHLVW